MSVLIPVLSEEHSIYYIDSSSIIKFISNNSDMDLNDVYRFVRKHQICNDEHGPTYWDRSCLINYPYEYDDEAVKWMTMFFDTHPWINRMMVVFDD